MTGEDPKKYNFLYLCQASLFLVKDIRLATY